MIQQEWKIKSRSGACYALGRGFLDGEAFITALFTQDSETGYVRRDFCQEAWTAQNFGDHGSQAPFSYWRSTFEAVIPDTPRQIMAKEGADGLLRRLIQEDDPATDNVRYILALMLERKRALKAEGERVMPDGVRLLLYRHGASGETVVVRDPGLRLDQLDEVQGQVIELLAAPPDAATAQSAPDVASPDGGI